MNNSANIPRNIIDIGIVNNMPDRALRATERQFAALIHAAANGMPVRLSFYALPDVPRADAGQRHIASHYSSIENLWDRHLDGLIVTGTEPRASKLTDEPYWESLTRLVEWAEHNTHSTIWSCLAAHAAVLHRDGITRRRLKEKRFGLFECIRASDHPLAAGVPQHLVMPHSRWNDVSEEELTAHGYSVLTRGEDAGVDAFFKQTESLFVFFQGHPEYEANTLLLEYGRDVGRYLRGENPTYPLLPRNYFNNDAADRLAALQERALSERRESLFADFQTVLTGNHLPNGWHSTATQIYGNWLRYLCARKEQRLNERIRIADRVYSHCLSAAGD